MIEKIKELIIKYREMIVYLICGVLTTAVDYAVYFICERALLLSGTVSQTAAVILSVLFAFFVNKIFVFLDRDWSAKGFIKQLVSFCGGRVVTSLLQIGAVWLFIDNLGFNSIIVKLIISVAVVILNYIISKLFVFGKKKKE